MAHDAVAARYAESLFAAAKAQRQLDETLEELVFLGRLLRGQPDLRELLFNPDVDAGDKIGVLERALKGGWSQLVRAFVRMVLAMDRAEALPGVAEALQEAVDQDRGRLRVVVRSARALPGGNASLLPEGLGGPGR